MTVPLMRCEACAAVWQFARAVCPDCGGRKVEAFLADGAGTVFSATHVRRAPAPEWEVEGGYGIALVTLDAGARVMVRGPIDLAIDERVTVGENERGLVATRGDPT